MAGSPSSTKVGHCVFCGERGKLSAEHPMSKRVLDLAGIGLDDVSLEFDIPIDQLTVEYIEEHMRTPLNDFVHCVCKACNNGWMQDLDHSFAGTVERWVNAGSHRLGSLGLNVITRYLAKVMWVRLLGEQWSLGPIEDGLLVSEVVLNPKFGEAIERNDLGEMGERLSVGVAKIESDAMFTYAAFTPQVEGSARNAGINRFSAGLVVALPAIELRLWLVYRMTPAMRTSWPHGVTWLGEGSRFTTARLAPSQPRIDDVLLAMS